MRRAPFVVAATAAGLALVLTFRTHVDGPGAAAKRQSLTSIPGGRAAFGNGSTPNGPVEVRVTVLQGRIVAVDNVALPSDNAHSSQLSQFSGPVLRRETLRAQSAHIDAVSGATMTSMAYQSSLQEALDKLRFRK
jgi:uncharacterized protein with FMN-binding domain